MEWILNITEAAKLMHGTPQGCSGDEIICSVSTDTRTLQEGALFFALQGERFDGHRFLKTALDAGAVCCVVCRDEEVDPAYPVIEVEDTLAAMRDLAAGYRKRFHIPVVGITGSVGKTSTKEMIASVLRQKYRTHMTKGNFNNEIGLPLTVFDLMKEDEMMVLEMGMSHFGEISRLTAIAKPDTAVITNIGVSHMENLGSREGILKAKFEILEGLQMDGAVILNGDDDLLWAAGGDMEYETLYYGIQNPSCDLCAFDVKTYSDCSEFSCKIDGETYKFVISVPGRHHIYNALAAILAGLRYNVDIEEIQKGIRQFQPRGLRQTVIQLPDYRVIRDCYNASPTSMQSGLSVLALMPCKSRRVACLADMLELGEISEAAHREVGKLVVEYGTDVLFTVGKAAHDIARGAEEAGMNPADIYEFEDNESLCARLSVLLKKGDVILVKGSRGMHLEEVADAIADLHKIESEDKE